MRKIAVCLPHFLESNLEIDYWSLLETCCWKMLLEDAEKLYKVLNP